MEFLLLLLITKCFSFELRVTVQGRIWKKENRKKLKKKSFNLTFSFQWCGGWTYFLHSTSFFFLLSFLICWLRCTKNVDIRRRLVGAGRKPVTIRAPPPQQQQKKQQTINKKKGGLFYTTDTLRAVLPPLCSKAKKTSLENQTDPKLDKVENKKKRNVHFVKKTISSF